MFRSRPHHRFARRRGGRLEMATHTWSRREDQAEIDLIGMIHMADRPFFETVKDRIGHLVAAGAVVHYERISKPSDDELAALLPRERDLVLSVRRRAIAQIEYMTEHTGLTYQSTVLDPDALGWHVNADVSLLDMLRVMGPRGFQDMAPDVDYADMPEAANRVVGSMVHWMARHAPAVRGVRLLGPHRAHVETWRNAVAMSHALRHFVKDPKTPIVAPWGAAHLPGMGDTLAYNGFELVATTWTPAIGKRSTTDV